MHLLASAGTGYLSLFSGPLHMGEDTRLFPRPLEIYIILCGLARRSNIFNQIWKYRGHAASASHTLGWLRLPRLRVKALGTLGVAIPGLSNSVPKVSSARDAPCFSLGLVPGSHA